MTYWKKPTNPLTQAYVNAWSLTSFMLLCLYFLQWPRICFSLFLVRQEQELRNGGTVDKKLSTLADLFRPPIELMHKGSFETVRSHSADALHHASLFSLGVPWMEGQQYPSCHFCQNETFPLVGWMCIDNTVEIRWWKPADCPPLHDYVTLM